jgi:hypothetical protein
LSITFCRDKGIRVKNFDLIFGPIVVNLEEKLFTKKKLSASTVADQKDEPVVDNKPAAKSEGSKLLSLNKKIDLFPEKVVLISCSTTDVCHFLLYMASSFSLYGSVISGFFLLLTSLNKNPHRPLCSSNV